MITLGIECSTSQGSAALLKDGEVLAETAWTAERIRHGVLFHALEELRSAAQVSFDEISGYAVGRGPGSFSGMRLAFAAAQALALPSKADVRAVSSGTALALALARKGFEQICVVGDARRGQVWYGFFQTLKNGGVRLSEPWKLIPYEEVEVPDDALVVSPDAERLNKYFPAIGTARFPHAREVAELASSQIASEPLEPLYMHPPVFVEPKYA